MRPRLSERLNQALAHRLTLVSAPAGTGKTTLVSAWAQSTRRQGTALGWLTLDTSDDEPLRFLSYLVACLEEGGLVMDEDLLPAESEEQTSMRAAGVTALAGRGACVGAGLCRSDGPGGRRSSVG